MKWLVLLGLTVCGVVAIGIDTAIVLRIMLSLGNYGDGGIAVSFISLVALMVLNVFVGATLWNRAWRYIAPLFGEGADKWKL